MYNRYVPQSDGSYRKSSIPSSPPPAPPKPQPCPPPDPPPTCEPPRPPHRQPNGAGDFLRHLIPKNLDTGDLLIIVLLLLMAGDCEENKSTWLLTLALYLFL